MGVGSRVEETTKAQFSASKQMYVKSSILYAFSSNRHLPPLNDVSAGLPSRNPRLWTFASAGHSPASWDVNSAAASGVTSAGSRGVS